MLGDTVSIEVSMSALQHTQYLVICDRLCENRPCSHLLVIRETLV